MKNIRISTRGSILSGIDHCVYYSTCNRTYPKFRYKVWNSLCGQTQQSFDQIRFLVIDKYKL